MAASHQARSIGKGRKDQVHGGDLPTLSAHQGVPDRRLLLAKVEGRGHEGAFAIAIWNFVVEMKSAYSVAIGIMECWLTAFSRTDQACAEADPCRSANTIQGHRHYRRF